MTTFTFPEGLLRAFNVLRQTEMPPCQQMGPQYCACLRCQAHSIMAQLQSARHDATTVYGVPPNVGSVEATREDIIGNPREFADHENSMVAAHEPN